MAGGAVVGEHLSPGIGFRRVEGLARDLHDELHDIGDLVRLQRLTPGWHRRRRPGVRVRRAAHTVLNGGIDRRDRAAMQPVVVQQVRITTRHDALRARTVALDAVGAEHSRPGRVGVLQQRRIVLHLGHIHRHQLGFQRRVLRGKGLDVGLHSAPRRIPQNTGRFAMDQRPCRVEHGIA
ncbi:hypothetical protein GALL_506290 [mine drainage metagenome]|uniref:Uncharacterized protein n=1 Tax=mine drainage metagenome TaxID=410659 RepID=A0A1J5PAP2_9ZZZZ